MNDDFLKAYRRQPSPAFAARLKRRLQAGPPAPRRAAAWVRRMGYAFAGLVLVFALAFAALPEARARAVSFVRQIGGLNVSQSSELPQSLTPPAAVALESIPVDEAVARFGGPVRLPDWLPSGFNLEPLAEVAGPPASAQELLFIHWRAGEQRITLMMRHLPENASAGLETMVRQGSAVQVLIDSRPGVLALGAWNAESGQFVPGSLTQLHWQADAGGRTIYSLIAASEDASADELIAVAASIP